MTVQTKTEDCPVCQSSDDAGPGSDLVYGWIGCELCQRWFHPSCVKLSAHEIETIGEYHCPDCSPKHGPSVLKRKSNRSRKKIDYIALNEGQQLREIDKHPHIDNFNMFENDRPLENLIYIVRPEVDGNEHGIVTDSKLTQIIFETQLKRPILVPACNPALPNYKNCYDLTFKFPRLTVDQIAEQVGLDKELPVMDVLTQNNSPNWTLGKWRDYFNSKAQDRDRIRNVISLEVSQTKLNNEIELPKSVLDIDVVNKIFSACKSELEAHEIEKPKVSKYILMSVKDSFTDFHIDFGGTSVYYTILQGHKQFLMFPPTKRNLAVYERWCLSEDQNSFWFGDLVPPTKPGKEPIDRAYMNNGVKIDIDAGDLLILPSGWIHSVYTPCDSIIVGGNFLNMLSLKNHLEVYKIEIDTKVPEKFKFPNFIKVIWLIGWFVMKYNNLSEFELQCLENLIPFYKSQLQDIENIDAADKYHKRVINRLKSSLPTTLVGKPADFVAEFERWYSLQTKKRKYEDM
ncbi:hypothetical protein KL921_001759 [Ogataea angusta]|uniref:JmjC domain-containing histone demethylation protein 1 n=1 Tax=Pichia angusta TaxID=870730 RepID=A0ABQ7S163_PICAN|nr:hypothetical protein KL921_001759 [Ogataea angusta]KAG7841336.1 hypothetical protein KL942_001215 [Ogataea angusta]KAG7851087.1 hypothetical protein KL940_001664 [Ogataea angusta]